MSIKIDNINFTDVKLTFSISAAADITGYDRSYIRHLIEIGELDYLIPPNRKQKRVTLFSLINFIRDNTYNNKERSADDEQQFKLPN